MEHCTFSSTLFKNHQPHLACEGGICSTKTENIQCGRVGVGLDTRIFTVNALHWCRSFIQLHLQLIWLTFEGLWPLQQRAPLAARHSQGPIWELGSISTLLCSAQLEEERNGWNYRGANVRGSVLSLAGVFMFPTVCKVCPLSLCDKSDCGRPRHTGVWPSAQDEEYFVEGQKGIIISLWGMKIFSLPLTSWVSGVTLDSRHYLQFVSQLFVWHWIVRMSVSYEL